MSVPTRSNTVEMIVHCENSQFTQVFFRHEIDISFETKNRSRTFKYSGLEYLACIFHRDKMLYASRERAQCSLVGSTGRHGWSVSLQRNDVTAKTAARVFLRSSVLFASSE